jgi:alkanesulfonate monooxygenase SsuD/methylene tetrahydromethanopterin reductase-like flavin-dependent oxidoreductase (luciferase family)
MDLRNPVRWERARKTFYKQKLESIRYAEEVGLDTVWFTEHHFWEDGYLPQPLTMAAAAAAVTSTLTLGTAIVLAPLRPAVDIAEQASIVDNIGGGGRFELGLGAGYCVPEFQAFGADIASRFHDFEDRITCIRRLWDDGKVTPRPVSDRIPIWIGGFGPRTARIAARTGEGLLHNDPALFPVYKAALEKYGRDPRTARIGGTVNLIVNDDPEAAWPRIAPHLAYQSETYAYYGNIGADERAGAAPDAVGEAVDRVDPETFRTTESVLLWPKFDVVTPEDAVHRIREWHKDLPIEHIYFWDSVAGMPDDLARRHVELLGTQVGPALRKFEWRSHG